jgi:hypothetical protein
LILLAKRQISFSPKYWSNWSAKNICIWCNHAP